ncbi:MAG: energy transducer TonB [Saprospiraceae bacterium]|nr:energy transducer TonB [Saprospiraceae bacterium]
MSNNPVCRVVALTMGLFLFAFAKDACAQNGEAAAIVIADKNDGSKSALNALNQPPRFPGCELTGRSIEEKIKCAEEKLQQYITDNLQYPDAAKSPDFKPVMVRVRVTVDANGKVHSPRILDLGIKEYDANALAVLKKMERDDVRWLPAIADGQATRTPVMVTVVYSWEGRNKAFPTLDKPEDEDEIYELPDDMPALGTCRQKGRKDEHIRDCSLEHLNDFFLQHLIYPEDALRIGLEGDIQVEFVVGRDGHIRNLALKNDIGLGCGEEVRRLFQLLKEKNIVWLPGEENGEKVSVLLRTTVRFRLKSSERPTVKMANADPKPFFATGKAGYEYFQDTYLKSPKTKDPAQPCAFGVVDVKFKINQQTGAPFVLEMIDYNNLGKEFKAAATAFLQETSGQWRVQYPALGSETQYYLSLPFATNSAACPDLLKGYKEVIYQALSDAALAEKEKSATSMEALDKAVRLFPADNKIRHLRGMALYKTGRTLEGCVDLFFVNKQNKEIPVPANCK